MDRNHHSDHLCSLLVFSDRLKKKKRELRFIECCCPWCLILFWYWKEGIIFGYRWQERMGQSLASAVSAHGQPNREMCESSPSQETWCYALTLAGATHPAEQRRPPPVPVCPHLWVFSTHPESMSFSLRSLSGGYNTSIHLHYTPLTKVHADRWEKVVPQASSWI